MSKNNRLDQIFSKLREENQSALIPYITAGDPSESETLALMHTLVANGADVLEIGVPFSDPMADGPVIQRAHERALKANLGLKGVLNMVARFREHDAQTPVVLMGYQNPIEAMGVAEFAQKAADCGVDGVLTVDLPPEEADSLIDALHYHGLHAVFLLAPTTTENRVEAVARRAGGFVYYVSLKGVTGAANLDVDKLQAQLQPVRNRCQLPVGVGFGIRDAQSAAAVARVADAVIVGSAIVGLAHQFAHDPEQMHAEVGAFAAELKAAIKTARQ